MDVQIQALVSLLESAGIACCFSGELALQYYNVPRVVHDLEICVPAGQLQNTAKYLTSTGLYKIEELKDFNYYTEYKRGYPRLRSVAPDTSVAVVIFDDISQGLFPLDMATIPSKELATCIHLSPQISDSLPASLVRSLSWPRLPSLFLGLCQRYLNNHDAIARIGAEQLVDGMNLSQEWCDMNLLQANREVLELAYTLVLEKPGRIDPFSGNKITCYIVSEHDAQLLRGLAGSSFGTAPKPALRTMPNREARNDPGLLAVNISSTMTSHARMNDAAIALSRVLIPAGVKFGIFGGYAIATYGGPRQSKDIDCLAASDKQKLLELLDGKEGFSAVPQPRDDYVAFLWSDKPDRSGGILVEIFPEQFQDKAAYRMQDTVTNAVQLTSTKNTNGTCYFLDLFIIFKGKLKAAVDRSKFHDSADLRWLAHNFQAYVAPHVKKLDHLRVGLAMQRYPELESTFRQLNIDIEAAKQAAAPYDVNKTSPLARGEVQIGLLSESQTYTTSDNQPRGDESESSRSQQDDTKVQREWEWDNVQKMYKIYDDKIKTWVFNDEKAGYIKYWANGQWNRRQ